MIGTLMKIPNLMQKNQKKQGKKMKNSVKKYQQEVLNRQLIQTKFFWISTVENEVKNIVAQKDEKIKKQVVVENQHAKHVKTKNKHKYFT